MREKRLDQLQLHCLCQSISSHLFLSIRVTSRWHGHSALPGLLGWGSSSGIWQRSDRPPTTLPTSVTAGHCLGQRWPCHSSFSTHPRLLWSPEPLPGPAPSSMLLAGHWDRTELWANFLYSVVSPTSLNFFFIFFFLSRSFKKFWFFSLCVCVKPLKARKLKPMGPPGRTCMGWEMCVALVCLSSECGKPFRAYIPPQSTHPLVLTLPSLDPVALWPLPAWSPCVNL